jgi:magnesium-protoporphyrin IX monomethyl ester (oxidative) cyclase
MLGLPGETREQSLRTIEFALSLPIDFAQFAICVPYPGSRMHEELVAKGELGQEREPEQQVDSWKRFSAYLSYTDLEPIYAPVGRQGQELKDLQKYAIRKFYLRPRQICKEIRKFCPRYWKSYLKAIRTVFFT